MPHYAKWSFKVCGCPVSHNKKSIVGKIQQNVYQKKRGRAKKKNTK